MSGNLYYAPQNVGRSGSYNRNCKTNNYDVASDCAELAKEKAIFRSNRNTTRSTFVTLVTNPCNFCVTFACLFFGLAVVIIGLLMPTFNYVPGPVAARELVVQLPSAQVVEEVIPVGAANTYPPPRVGPQAEVIIGPTYSSTITDAEVQCPRTPFTFGNVCLQRWAIAGSVRLPNGMSETMRFRGNTCGAVCENVPGLLNAFTGVCVCTTSPII